MPPPAQLGVWISPQSNSHPTWATGVASIIGFCSRRDRGHRCQLIMARHELRSGLRQRLHRRPGVVAGGGRAGWPASERGSLLQEQYDHVFTVEPAAKAKKTIDWVHRILEEERDIVIASPPLEAADLEVENIRWPYVFYENGLSINVRTRSTTRRSERSGSSSPKGWRFPPSLARSIRRQKSKLAGTIRGSYFVIKGEY